MNQKTLILSPKMEKKQAGHQQVFVPSYPGTALRRFGSIFLNLKNGAKRS